MEDKAEEGVFQVSEGELLPENVCCLFEEESRREAVLGVCEYDGEEAGRANRLVEKGCVEFETQFCGEDGAFK